MTPPKERLLPSLLFRPASGTQQFIDVPGNDGLVMTVCEGLAASGQLLRRAETQLTSG